MSLSRQHLITLLHELHDAFLLEDAAPVEWIVCGGTALVLLELSARATQDIDVLGNFAPAPINVLPITGFPQSVAKAVARVAAAHPELAGSGPQWVNLGPQAIVNNGLPEGFAQRLTHLRIGERLTLHLLGRFDLIALKLYAAADDMGHRQRIHFDDLRMLQPSTTEVDRAIAWVLRMPDPHYCIRPSLTTIVKELGHEDLAYYI